MPPTKSKDRTRTSTRSEKTVKQKALKRPLSPSPETVAAESHPNKKKIVITEAGMDELRNLITDSTRAIETKINQSQQSVEEKISVLTNKVDYEVNEIKNSVNEFKSNVAHEITNIKTQIVMHNHRIDNTEDDVQRIERNQALRLIGIPAKNNENLVNYLAIIADLIGHDLSSGTNIPLVERFKVKDRSNGQMVHSNTIIIHFATWRQKQIFYSQYLKVMPLDPSKFGLPASNRIFLGENLTKKNIQIFKQAQIMKKNKQIAQAFTIDGIVKIRLKKGEHEPTHTIRDIITLETLVANYAQPTQSNAMLISNTSNGVTPTTNLTNSTQNQQQQAQSVHMTGEE